MTIEKLREQIVNTAMCYGFQLNAGVVNIHTEALKGFPYDDCIKAYQTYIRDSKSLRMPVPAQILAILKPNIEHQDIGILSAAKIVQAVSKFGYSSPDEAKNFIGPLGWQVVRVFGGWDYVCKNLGVTLDLTTFQAQAREISRAESKVVAAGANQYSLTYDPDEPIQIENNKKMGELLALCKPKEI